MLGVIRDKQEPYSVVNYSESYRVLCFDFAHLIGFPVYLLLHFTTLYSLPISFWFATLFKVVTFVQWTPVHQELVLQPNLLLSCPVVVTSNH